LQVEYNGASLVNLKLKLLLHKVKKKYIDNWVYNSKIILEINAKKAKYILFEVRMNQNPNPGIQFQQCQMA
jgi:hypothetical protein